MAGSIIYDLVVKEDLALGVGTYIVPAPAGGQMVGSRINLGTFSLASYSGAWAPATVNSTTPASTTVTVAGAQVGDIALATFTGSGFLASQYVFLQCKVISANTVEVTMHCAGTVLDVNPGTGTLKVLVFPVA